jgi:hypothetical protein
MQTQPLDTYGWITLFDFLLDAFDAAAKINAPPPKLMKVRNKAVFRRNAAQRAYERELRDTGA